MGSGGEQPKQKRQVSKKLEGVEPIVIPANTNNDVSQPIRTNTANFLPDDREPLRSNSTAIRLDLPPGVRNRTTGSHQPTTAIPARRQQARQRNTLQYPDPLAQQEKLSGKFHIRPHWLIFIGIGMVILLILWVLGSAALAWGRQRLDDVQYGYPRTSQVDSVVGHGDSAKNPSHFIAMNLHRQAVVIEFSGSDPTKANTYLTPVFISGSNGDLAPVTLEFRDVNGDGKADMLIHIHLPGQDQISVFINDGAKFRPSNGTDKITL